MVKVQNTSPRFNILYLKNRTLRFNSKEIKKITEKELDSDEFKRRKDEFKVIEDKKEEPDMSEEVEDDPKEESEDEEIEEIDYTDNEESKEEDKEEPSEEEKSEKLIAEKVKKEEG